MSIPSTEASPNATRRWFHRDCAANPERFADHLNEKFLQAVRQELETGAWDAGGILGKGGPLWFRPFERPPARPLEGTEPQRAAFPQDTAGVPGSGLEFLAYSLEELLVQMVGEPLGVRRAVTVEHRRVAFGDASVTDEYPVHGGHGLPGGGRVRREYPVEQELAESPTLPSLLGEAEPEEDGELVVPHEHLGRLALDDFQTALDIRSPIDEVARVDEGVGAGAEAAVLQGRGDEFRVAVGIGDDERAGRSGLRHRTVDPVLLCDVVVHSVSSIAGTRRAGPCRPRRRGEPPQDRGHGQHRRPPWHGYRNRHQGRGSAARLPARPLLGPPGSPSPAQSAASPCPGRPPGRRPRRSAPGLPSHDGGAGDWPTGRPRRPGCGGSSGPARRRRPGGSSPPHPPIWSCSRCGSAWRLLVLPHRR